MNLKEALARLKSLGTAQNRKVYARHGVTGLVYGVSYADQGKLAKAWKGEHELALGLWDSGVHDARVLATFIVDGARLRAADLDAWVRDVEGHVMADALAGVVVRTPHARSRAARWRATRGEWPSTVGWNVTARLAAEPGDGSAGAPSDAELEDCLEIIRKGIHAAPNRTRYAMNGALIAIGGYRPALRAAALEAARRIGKVEVDHGETGCKTPDAAPYINKMAARATAAKRPGRAAKKPAGTSRGRAVARS